MILVLASSNSAVVTGRTRAQHLCVIDGHHGCKHIGRVTVFANIRCLRMRRIFAGCVGAVVAAHTIAHDVYVIKVCGQPGDSAVAVIAVIAASDVALVLAGGNNTVVTVSTVTQYLSVIYHHDR